MECPLPTAARALEHEAARLGQHIPHVGVGSWMPTPRKLKADSKTMTRPAPGWRSPKLGQAIGDGCGGKIMRDSDAPCARRGFYKVLVAQRQRHAAHQARRAQPAEGDQDQDEDDHLA